MVTGSWLLCQEPISNWGEVVSTSPPLKRGVLERCLVWSDLLTIVQKSQMSGFLNCLILATKNQMLYGPNKNVYGYGNLSDPDRTVHFTETEAQRSLAFSPNSKRKLVAESGQTLNRLNLRLMFLPLWFWRESAGTRLPRLLHFDLNRGSCCPVYPAWPRKAQTPWNKHGCRGLESASFVGFKSDRKPGESSISFTNGCWCMR